MLASSKGTSDNWQPSGKRYGWDGRVPVPEDRGRRPDSRLPVYGDYGVIHPDRVEPIGEPRSLPRIPKIRYASGDEMLMIRGHDLRSGDDGQLGVLLSLLKENGAWPGPNFSDGDDAWFDPAARGEGAITNGTWKVGQAPEVSTSCRNG